MGVETIQITTRLATHLCSAVGLPIEVLFPRLVGGG